MDTHWTYTFAEFGPSEVEHMTGMSANLQRVWRRRGHLPSSGGAHARFKPLLAAEIAVRHVLAGRGIPPSQSAAIGNAAAPHVLWSALMDADGACEVYGTPSAVAEFQRDFHDNETLASQIAGLGVEQPKRFIIAEDFAEPSLESGFSQVELGEYVVGQYLNLATLGRRFAERAQRPLVTVQLEPAPTTPAERRRQLRRLVPARGG